MISFDEALQSTLQQADFQLESEPVSLAESLGRRLAEPVHSDAPWPTTDRSAMDGFAVRAGASGLVAGTQLDVVGECLAGHPFAGTVSDGQAIRIMTGAVVPGCVDCVVPVENTSGYEGARVTLSGAVSRGDNVRPVGSEVAAGQLLMDRGQRIGAAEIGALAVLGVDPVPVVRRPVVAILATGDEVVEVDKTPQPHQVRNSNAHALAAQVVEAGGQPLLLGIARDEESDLRHRIQKGLGADFLLSIGGVSKGTHDLVHHLYKELDVETIYHGVAIKPGKPTFFGRRRDPEGNCFVFGLPGNPASCFTIFDLLVLPLLASISGAEITGEVTAEQGRACVAGQPFRKNRRLQAVPTSLRLTADGGMLAELHSSKPSGDPFSLLGARGYALIPAEQGPEQTELVEIRGLDKA